jgi:hypothetical protein
MSLSLNVLNSDCSLNAFLVASSASIVGGETAEIVLQLWQPSKKMRYMPASGATFSMDLLKSDGTVLTKIPTLKFPSDDRSVLLLSLSAAETAVLISQNLILKVTEGSNISMAILQMGLQKVSLVNC